MMMEVDQDFAYDLTLKDLTVYHGDGELASNIIIDDTFHQLYIL